MMRLPLMAKSSSPGFTRSRSGLPSSMLLMMFFKAGLPSPDFKKAGLHWADPLLCVLYFALASSFR